MDMNQLMQALRNADAAGDTVAASRIAQMIQKQRQQQTAAPAQERSVVENLGTGMMDRVYAIGEGITDFLPTVTKAITGYENPSIYIPTGDDGFQFSDLKNIQMRDAKDVPAEAKNPFGFTGTEFEDAADYLAKNRKALNYQPLKPWNEVKANPSAANVLAFMGEAAVTSLPDMAAALISAPAYFASYVSPIAEKRAANDGRTQVTPEDLAYAAVTAAGIASAERFGAKGVFGQNAGNAAQRIVGAGVKESGTEAIQNPLQYAGETVGTETGFDVAEAGDQALAGAVGGLGAGSGLRTGTEVITAGGQTAPEDTEAAGNLARRLEGTAKNNKFNTGNVSQAMDVKGARALVDQAHVNISDEISTEQKALKKELTHDTKNDTDVLKQVKNLAKSALRNARNKTKGIVTKEEFNAVEQLVGGTAEGQRMLSLMRESNELTTLHNQGLKGGISRFTDKINPLSFGEGYATKKLVETAGKTALYGGAFAGAGPAGPIALGAAAIGGRAIDAVTGKRSNVANFIRQNRDNTGVREAKSPSVRTALDEQNQARQERSVLQETLNRQDFDANRPITNEKSPAGMINKDTGLDRQQQVAIAEQMLEKPEHQDIKAQLEQLIRSVKGFNQRVDNISNVSSRILEEVRKQNIPTSNQQNTNNNSQQIPGGIPPVSPLDMARRQQGIQDNRQRVDTLREQAAADETLSQDDKGLVEDALLDLKRDLGRNPVEAAERIINGAADLAENRGRVLGHLVPYLQRVQQQQSNKDAISQDINFSAEQKSEQEVAQGKELSTHLNLMTRFQDVGNLKRLNIDAVQTLDPEGRKTVSKFVAGLNGEPMKPREMANLMPFLVDAFEFMQGNKERTTLGVYQGSYSSSGLPPRIGVLRIGEDFVGNQEMTPDRFFRTFAHEIGHAIEAKSGLREMVDTLRYASDADGNLMMKDAPDIMAEAVRISKIRRPSTWKSLQDTTDSLTMTTGIPVNLRTLAKNTNHKVLMPMHVFKAREEFQQALLDSGQIEKVDNFPTNFHGLMDMMQYLYSPSELSADAVAHYMTNPKDMKEKAPLLASKIREAVNNHPATREYITFHTIAGLLGAGAMMSLIIGMGDDEETKGILSLGSGPLSSAA